VRQLFEGIDQERKPEQKDLPVEAVFSAKLELVASEEPAKLGRGGDLGAGDDQIDWWRGPR